MATVQDPTATKERLFGIAIATLGYQLGDARQTARTLGAEDIVALLTLALTALGDVEQRTFNPGTVPEAEFGHLRRARGRVARSLHTSAKDRSLSTRR
jgi:hypothetical protein